MSSLKSLEKGLVEVYGNTPKGRYVTVVLTRETQSETIFRTEGSGCGCNKEYVALGIKNSEIQARAIISKRKQTAVERRTGREMLREAGLLGECTLNNNAPCEKCMDCMIDGFAVGAGGAQKSRVIYDNAYSIRKFDEITGKKTFNALYENGTMRDENGNASSSIQEDEYIKPGTIFLDMVTLKDLTEDEFIYVMGSILRSKRYGAMSSRIGKIKNEVLSFIVSDCEMFSNNELTQMVYDELFEGNNLKEAISKESINKAAKTSIEALSEDIFGEVNIINDEDTIKIVNEIKEIMKDKTKLKEVLERQTKAYGE